MHQATAESQGRLMSDLPLVTIVIPTWNRREDLLKCLVSVEQLDYPNVGVIVVDNASTDGTATAVHDQFRQADVIELPENLGAVGASNIGFRRALENDAQYFLRLDSDTVLAPDFVNELVAAAEAHQEAGLLVGKILYLDDPVRIWSLGARFRGFLLGTIEIGRDQEDGPQFDSPFRVDFAWSTGFMLTRQAFEQTNGFDPDFFVYYEEPDLCLRLLRAGMQIWCIPSAKMWHRIGESRPSSWIAYQWGRGKMLFIRKHTRGVKRLALVAYAYLYAFFRAAFPKRGKGNRGPLVDAISGLTSGLRHPITRA